MNTSCSNEMLQAALAGTLTAEDDDLLRRHLETCESCSAALEQMAGGPAWCQEAASLLIGDELDAATPSGERWSEIDFTVEHLEPSDEPGVLGRLGGYDVLEIIGQGGMGVVLKAFDRQLKRCVAMKVLAPHLAHSSLARQRFGREAQAAAAIVHPHVLAIHQVQPGGRLPFLVMPLVAGESLAERLTAQGTLELKEILRIGMQAAAGLSAAHEQGLVHRDVKPANILLEKGVERAVLTDFGLARAADDVALTRWGIIAGTPQYMSPEQARGEPLDGRSDLFSLGCVLYEMATGVSPFRADSLMATLRRLIDESPRAIGSLNPELPPWFVAIVDRLLEKDPARRFGSARQVSELLEGCLAHVQQPASVPLPAELPRSAAGRARRPSKKLIIGVLAMFTASALGLLSVFLLSAAPPDISGEWSGDDWGQVVLKKSSSSEYSGTFSETSGKQSGEMQLRWSHVERRFNGDWHEGQDRFGQISIRLADDGIRGAYTTDLKSKINPGTPALADLAWTKSGPDGAPLADRGVRDLTRVSDPASGPPQGALPAQPPKAAAEPAWIFGPVVERTVQDFSTRRGCCLKFETGELLTPPFEIKHTEDMKELSEWARQAGADLVADENSSVDPGPRHRRALTVFDLFYIGPESWDAATADEAVDTVPYYEAQLERGQDKDWLRTGFMAAADPPRTPQDLGNATWFFRTRHDRIGMLQITGFKKNPPGVKLRYKLVRRNPNHGPASKTPPGQDASARGATGDPKAGPLASPDVFSPATGDVVARAMPTPDKGLGEACYRLRLELGRPRHVLLGKAYFVDGQTKNSSELDQLNFFFASPDGASVERAEVSWSIYKDDSQGEPDLWVKVNGDRGSVSDFSTSYRFGGKTSDENVIEPIGFEPAAMTWKAAAAQPPISLRPGEGSQGKPALQTLRMFDGFGPDGALIGSIELKLQVVPMRPDAQADETTPVLRNSDQAHNKYLAALIGPSSRQASAAQRSRPVLEFHSHREVSRIAFSRDGKLLAVSEREGKVGLYNGQTGQQTGSLEMLNEKEKATLDNDWMTSKEDNGNVWVHALAFSPDANLLAVGDNFGQVKLFDARSGALKLSLDDVDRTKKRDKPEDKSFELPLALDEVTALAFSPDGSLLATCGGSMPYDYGKDQPEHFGPRAGVLKLWDVKTGKLKQVLGGNEGESVNELAFSPDGKLLAIAGDWRSHTAWVHPVKLWDPATAKVVKVLPSPRGTPTSLAFSPDGQRLAIGLTRHPESDALETHGPGIIDVVSVASGSLDLSWALPHLNCVAFSPDGKTIAAFTPGVTDVSPNDDSKDIAQNGPQGSLTLWDSSTGLPQGEIRPPRSSSGRWSCFASVPGTNRVATGGSGGRRDELVSVWDLGNVPAGSSSRTARPSLPVELPDAMPADAEADPFADGPESGPPDEMPPDAEAEREVPAEAQRRRVDAGPEFTPLLNIHQQGSVETIACSPDGKVFATNDDGSGVILYDAQTGDRIAMYDTLSEDERAQLANLRRSKKAIPQAAENIKATRLAFSPDSRLLAVGNGIGQVKVFDAHTGALTMALVDPDLKPNDENPLDKPLGDAAHVEVWKIAFSPDGSRLATCGASTDSDTIWIENLPDEKLSSEGILKIWDAKTGKLLHDLKGYHLGYVSGVAFSPDGKRLASAGHWLRGSGVKLWDTETYKAVLVIPTAEPHSVVFSPDGKQIVITEEDLKAHRHGYSIGVADTTTGIFNAKWPMPTWTSKIGFLGDGKAVAALHLAIPSLTLWDSSTWQPLAEISLKEQYRFVKLPGLDINRELCAAFVPETNRVAIGGTDDDLNGVIRVWDLDREAVANHRPRPRGYPARATIPQSDLPVDIPADSDEGDVRESSPTFVRDDSTEGGPPTRARVRPTEVHGKFEAEVGGPSSRAPVRPGPTDEAGPRLPLLTIREQSSIQSIACSYDGKILATGDDVSDVNFYNAQTGKKITTFSILGGRTKKAISQGAENIRATVLAFSHASNLLAVGNSIGQVKLFDTRTAELVRTLGDPDPKPKDEKTLDKSPGAVPNFRAWGIALSPDDSQLAVCGRDYKPPNEDLSDAGILKIWNPQSGKLLGDLKGEHIGQVNAVAFSPDGKLLASAGPWPSGSGVKLWNTETFKVVKSLPTGAALSVAFSPDGKRLAITQAEDGGAGSIAVADIASGVVETQWPIAHWAEQIGFVRDGKAVVALDTTDPSPVLWDSSTGQPLGEMFPHQLFRAVKVADGQYSSRELCGAFVPGTNRVAIGGSDAELNGVVQVWDLDAAAVAKGGPGGTRRHPLSERIPGPEPSEPAEQEKDK